MSDFLSASRYLLTSESVTEGHPDKVCDQISDAILDGILNLDKNARVACETAITKDLLVVMGEVTTTAYLDIQGTIQRVLEGIGYVDANVGFDASHALIQVYLKEQSPDIAGGVNHSLEERQEDAKGENDVYDSQGAGDQGMMIGFACDETPELMPLPIILAHRLAHRLAEVRKDGTLPYLRPDGKTQVTVEYRHGVPHRIDSVVLSTQHSPHVSQEEISRDIQSHVLDVILPREMIDKDTHTYINPSGRFEIGGPAADAGLTGRKIIVDTYGGAARHGGGAFSGKDPSKVDRSAAYAARWVAKNIVAAGFATRCEVQVSYAIGKAQPTSISVETFGTGKYSSEKLSEMIAKVFDLRPAAIIDKLNLRQPIYEGVASYGHFGRLDLDLPWERTDKVSELQRLA